MGGARKTMIVAIDGPAGSGKSSVCAMISQRTGFTYINTGFLYRAVGVLARERGLPLDENQGLLDLIDEFTQGAVWHHAEGTLLFKGRNLTPLLGTIESGNDASFLAKLPSLRSRLIPMQRQLISTTPKGALVDGRDIGTVVFPDADLKIFMTASLLERAKRRLDQLERTGYKPSGAETDEHLSAVMMDINRRDEQDRDRAVAPLKKAEDAILLDTSGMDADEACESVIALMRAKNLL